MIFSLMAYQPSAEEREAARRTRRALKEKMGLLVKQIADVLGKPEPYIQDQLSGRRPLGHRWEGIEGFALALAEVIAEEHGAFLILKRDVRLIAIETAPKRMAKAQLPAEREEQAS